jgi:hypothetical protein
MTSLCPESHDLQHTTTDGAELRVRRKWWKHLYGGMWQGQLALRLWVGCVRFMLSSVVLAENWTKKFTCNYVTFHRRLLILATGKVLMFLYLFMFLEIFKMQSCQTVRTNCTVQRSCRCLLYEGESVNRSQMDMKHKTYEYFIKTFISRHILHQHWYTFTIALPVRRNPQHRNLFDCCLSHFRTSVSTSSSSAKRLPVSCEPLYATNTSHRKQEIFHTGCFCPRIIAQQNVALRHFTPQDRHFDYWN